MTEGVRGYGTSRKRNSIRNSSLTHFDCHKQILKRPRNKPEFISFLFTNEIASERWHLQIRASTSWSMESSTVWRGLARSGFSACSFWVPSGMHWVSAFSLVVDSVPIHARATFWPRQYQAAPLSTWPFHFDYFKLFTTSIFSYIRFSHVKFYRTCSIVLGEANLYYIR